MASEVLVVRNFFVVTFRRSTIDELEVRRMQQGNPVSGGFHHDGKLSTLSRIQESKNPRLGALLLACFAVQVLRLVTGLGSPSFADWKGSSF